MGLKDTSYIHCEYNVGMKKQLQYNVRKKNTRKLKVNSR